MSRFVWDFQSYYVYDDMYQHTNLVRIENLSTIQNIHLMWWLCVETFQVILAVWCFSFSIQFGRFENCISKPELCENSSTNYFDYDLHVVTYASSKSVFVARNQLLAASLELHHGVCHEDNNQVILKLYTLYQHIHIHTHRHWHIHTYIIYIYTFCSKCRSE